MAPTDATRKTIALGYSIEATKLAIHFTFLVKDSIGRVIDQFNPDSNEMSQLAVVIRNYCARFKDQYRIIEEPVWDSRVLMLGASPINRDHLCLMLARAIASALFWDYMINPHETLHLDGTINPEE